MNPVEEIKQRLDIVDVISESVNLQRSGRNYRALCPFHAEKAPSFFVFPDRGTWHCFGGCATGGDVFAFVMKKEGLDFSGALRVLAEKAGISLGRKSGAAEETEKDRLRQANEAAALFFQHALLNTQAGAAALEYLTMRGIDRQTAEAFQLGYAPDSWDALREHLKGRGFGEGDLLKAGLAVEGDRGVYDRFRRRVTIPIRDERGRAVGFGSRMLPAESGDGLEAAAAESESPKYLNTPQTPIFDKGAVLFGLDRAAEHIRRADLAVIVEGYMDVIAAHQHDNLNVVASMGTALTERQLALLRRLTENIVLAFDPDTAGRAASERGDVVAQRMGAQIRVMKLPKGRDPDEIIRADPEAWRRFVVEAEAPKAFSGSTLQATPTEHGRKVAARRKAPATPEEEKIDLSKGEETCLALLMRYPHLRSQGQALSGDLFDDTLNRQILEAWRETGPEHELLEAVSDDSLRQRLEHIVARNLPPYDSGQAERALATCTERLKKGRIRDEKRVRNWEIAEREQRLGAGRLVEHARKLMRSEAPSQDLSEDATAGAEIVVRDMEAGLELHEKKSPREEQQHN
ncbi:MAG TPA: DNA primase [Dehalococcoidia bacterium]|nr:DNA primase [Dehalococcoidia bacterium]